ncbi:unnamed protein product [Protopolystoma xenopodis]|uniref:Uncharacterized protein n=1 Tax=Protopolystoma xenopodis TaxID=117903 RepID=A0A3S5CPV4_9PLAT|nr:unnamed protein product [Protopolystoma xenopodis]
MYLFVASLVGLLGCLAAYHGDMGPKYLSLPSAVCSPSYHPNVQGNCSASEGSSSTISCSCNSLSGAASQNEPVMQSECLECAAVEEPKARRPDFGQKLSKKNA